MKCLCGFESDEVIWRGDKEWNEYVKLNKYYKAWKGTFRGMYACPICGTIRIGEYKEDD